MRFKLKSYFFTTAMLIATAAHAEAAADARAAGRDDTTYGARGTSAEQPGEYAAPDRNETSMSQEAAGAQRRPSEAADPAGKTGTVGIEAPDHTDPRQQTVWMGP